ncbi:MAG: MATE family efflux transporter [Chlorobi bacterium]|nr:MATE family efflux transporter [Chlorobiota bacterium]
MNWKDYTREFKTNWQLAWPVMVAYLGQVLVGLADNIMVGKLGPRALAAISLANSTIFFVMSFGIGFSAAITPLVSEALGLNDKERIHRILYTGLLVNGLLGLFMIAAIWAMIPFLEWTGQPPEVLAVAVPYIKIVGVSVLFVMLFQAMKQFADGLGYTKISMHATIVVNIVNVLISYVLIYGVWIFPRLEVLGAGLGTMIARFLILFVFWYFLSRDPRTRHYVTHLPGRIWDPAIVRKILSLGFPSGFQSVFEMGIFTATVWLAGTLGALPQAANQIALQMASMTFMVFVGLGVAATVRTGYRLGAKDYANLRRVAMSVFLQAVLIGAFFAVLYMALRHYLPWIYLSRKHGGLDSEQVAQMASGLLIIAGLFQIFDSLQVTLQGALRGMQDVKIPAVITFTAYWLIGFPVAWFGSRIWGVYGIWFGLLAGLGTAAVLLFIRFHYLTRRWEKKYL